MFCDKCWEEECICKTPKIRVSCNAPLPCSVRKSYVQQLNEKLKQLSEAGYTGIAAGATTDAPDDAELLAKELLALLETI